MHSGWGKRLCSGNCPVPPAKPGRNAWGTSSRGRKVLLRCTKAEKEDRRRKTTNREEVHDHSFVKKKLPENKPGGKRQLQIRRRKEDICPGKKCRNQKLRRRRIRKQEKIARGSLRHQRRLGGNWKKREDRDSGLWLRGG